MFNPVVSMLHNVKLNRWHPILFYESPLPGPPSPDKPVRHRSKGHHTQGFDTREAALISAKDLAEKIAPESIGPVSLALEADFPWDGEDIPAMVVYFAINKGKAVPMIA
jgi:hypothetical protein